MPAPSSTSGASASAGCRLAPRPTDRPPTAWRPSRLDGRPGAGPPTSVAASSTARATTRSSHAADRRRPFFRRTAARMTDRRPIGGMFGREHLGRRARAARFLREPAMRVVNARSAIFLALRSVRPQTVWLPSYLCAAVADACVAANAATAFYPVDAHLRIAPSAFARVRRGDMVVVIDYFGFPHPPAIFRALRRAGAVVLEDASQAMFSAGVGRWADFVAYSPRKFVGVAEGGILALRRGRSATVTLARPPARWLRTARDAIRARTRFDASRTRATAGWFRLFQKAE